MVKRIEQDEKICFAIFEFEVHLNISASAKFSHSETNQTSFLSHVGHFTRIKKIHKMAAPQLCQA